MIDVKTEASKPKLKRQNTQTIATSTITNVGISFFLYLLSAVVIGGFLCYEYYIGNAHSKLFYVLTLLIACDGLGLLLLTIHGEYLKANPQIPFDADALAAEGGKYVVTASGRKIEYFVFGSDSPDAKVHVYCHPSMMTAKIATEIYDAATLKSLNVKMIAPSYPGNTPDVSTWTPCCWRFTLI